MCLRLIGGLGNQLFSYAYARSLAEDTQRNLVIDTVTGFVKDNYNRKPRLKSFVASYEEAPMGVKMQFFLVKAFPNLSSRLLKIKYQKELDSRGFEGFDQSENRFFRLVFIEGYFQSYLYFERYKELIKREIVFNFIKTQEVLAFKEDINSLNSVSVHVRRTDYDALPLQYYRDSTKCLLGTLDRPHFFIFSDDIGWCEENFAFLKSKTFIKHDSADELSDLWLMTQCKHHIIANSSFSWWGAWLSSHMNCCVIAPKNSNIGVKGALYPPEWILM